MIFPVGVNGIWRHFQRAFTLCSDFLRTLILAPPTVPRNGNSIDFYQGGFGCEIF
jgi:hypothetical protein